jgi:hypothetical protein
MAVAGTTTDTTDRALDLAVLFQIDSINTVPKRMSLTVAGDDNTPYFITGLQKLVQRYVILFMTALNSNEYEPTAGTTLIQQYLRSAVTRRSQIVHLFHLSNAQVSDQIRREDESSAFGATPPLDEQLASAQLVSFAIDTGTATVRLRVKLTSQAGDTAVFVLPVPRAS